VTTAATVSGRPLTRRERLRTATLAEIKEIARRRLIEDGSARVSLRAIARDMGMTPAALYRYVPGIEALVEAILADVREEAARALEEARDAADPTDPLAQLTTLGRALRSWVLSHSAEFALALGEYGRHTPDPERPGVDDRLVPAYRELFLATVTRQWQRRPFPMPTDLDPELAGPLSAVAERVGCTLPLPALYVALRCYGRVWGAILVEVSGHLPVDVDGAGALFEAELADTVRCFRGPHD